MLHEFEDYEFEYDDDLFIINACLEANLEDYGLGQYEYHGVKGNDIDIRLSEILIIDWDMKIYNETKDCYDYSWGSSLENKVQDAFIKYVENTIIENIQEEIRG